MHIKPCDKRRLLHILLPIIYLLNNIETVQSWQKWNYTSSTPLEWTHIWNLREGPRPRQGHSLIAWKGSKIVLFGGRDNDAQTLHVPKTFKMNSSEFETYEEEPIYEHYNPESCQVETLDCVSSDETCTYEWAFNETTANKRLHEEICGYTEIALYYNDVWMYDMNCTTRFADHACVNQGWTLLHAGAKNFDSSLSIPSERWNHEAVTLVDDKMLVYGGYSQECEDYCQDLWVFDLIALNWTQLASQNRGPGKRWRFSLVSSSQSDQILLFGGHSLDGGYLDDLWSLNLVEENHTTTATWKRLLPKQSCHHNPGISWEFRNDLTCQIHWPKPRAGHASAIVGETIYIHGGYTNYFHQAHGIMDTRPYPTHPYFLDDLWVYNITTGYWTELNKPYKSNNSLKPKKRTDHTLLSTDQILILFGGYADNHHYNDTWYYYIHKNQWLQKNDFVHAYYPDTCTDDVEYIKKSEGNCVLLEYPKLLRRFDGNEGKLQSSSTSTHFLKYQDLLPYEDQEGYTPTINPKSGQKELYFGIVRNATQFLQELQTKYLENIVLDHDENRIWIQSDIPDGTPIAPYAATAPRQYAKKLFLKYNQSTTLQIWEWCTSVEGEPYPQKLIPQMRRKSPGWDGCRNEDGLTWKIPPSRSNYAAVYLEQFHTIFMYGGLGYSTTPSASTSQEETHPTQILNDLWTYNINNCIHNCSNNGICKNGFCICDHGFYGIDCSNFTCPGSVCFYDEFDQQHCTHCCHDFISSDSDVSEGTLYVPEIPKTTCQKLPQSNSFSGISNGICDGWGSCQCIPSFLGDDCSIQDCEPDNMCSLNGYCEISFPRSKCVCKPGYFGNSCEFIECLNNCSYPNGICDYKTGECQCGTIVDPMHTGGNWIAEWQGEDCSYLTPWCSAYTRRITVRTTTTLVFFCVLLLFVTYIMM